MSSKSCLVYFCASLKIQMATGSILADFLGSRITFLISRSRCYLYIYFNSNAFFSPAAGRWSCRASFLSLSFSARHQLIDWMHRERNRVNRQFSIRFQFPGQFIIIYVHVDSVTITTRPTMSSVYLTFFFLSPNWILYYRISSVRLYCMYFLSFYFQTFWYSNFSVLPSLGRIFTLVLK